MSDEFCNHGLLQLSKYGVDVDERGVETCRRCGRPTRDSYLSATAVDEGPVGSMSSPVTVGPRRVRDAMVALLAVGVLVAATGVVMAATALPDELSGGSQGFHYLGLFLWASGAMCALVALVAFGVSLGVRDAAQQDESARR